MQQKTLLQTLHGFQYAVETLKQLPPVLNMMLEQFPPEWEEEWIDRLYWLTEQLQGDIEFTIDELGNPLKHLIRDVETEHLQQVPPPAPPGRSPGERRQEVQTTNPPESDRQSQSAKVE